MNTQREQTTSPAENVVPVDHRHEWVVFSTALGEGWLMLQCVECGRHGTVEDPSSEEWSEAFHAPSRPYRWLDDDRVHVRDAGPFYVMRATASRRCDCYEKFSVRKPGKYERLPAEITRPVAPVTAEERADLESLAKLVAGSDLCSRYFPLFVRSYREQGGAEPTGAVWEMARRVEAIDAKGLHCSPGVVAALLRQYAGREPERSDGSG